jgi:hypothetical protein
VKYFILLLLSSSMGFASSCSEEFFLKGRAGGTEDEFMKPWGRGPRYVLEPLI